MPIGATDIELIDLAEQLIAKNEHKTLFLFSYDISLLLYDAYCFEMFLY